MRTIFKLLFATLLLSLLTACGDVTVYSYTDVVTTPARHDGAERGVMVFSCTTEAALYDNIDYGGVSRGCEMRPATATEYIGWYASRSGHRVPIYQFMLGGWWFYTADAG